MPSSAVTIVTPSLNQGRFIRAAVESVLSQDYPHLEYIIMDGGSTDETARIVQDYASRLTWISAPDRGQSHAINKGFRMAKGDIVAWLNSDDMILPGAVSAAVETLERCPASAAVYGEGYLIDENGSSKGRFPATQPFDLWRLVHVCDYILQQTVYFRKSAVAEAGYLDETLHWTMDWDILIKVGKRHRIEYIPKYMGCLREHAAAKSFQGGTRRIAEIRALLRRHTGRRLAPGAIYYGLETYRRLWCDTIEKRTPRWLEPLSAPLRRVIFVGAGYLIEHAARARAPRGFSSPST